MHPIMWFANGIAACSFVLVEPASCGLPQSSLTAMGRDTLICIPLPEAGVSMSVPVPKVPNLSGRPAVSIRREEPAHAPFVVKVNVTDRSRDPSIEIVGLETQESLAAFNATECEDCPFTAALDPKSLDPQRAALAARRPWRDYRFVQFGSTGFLASCQYYEPSGDYIAEYLTFFGQVRLVIELSSEAAATRKKVRLIAPTAMCDSLRAPFDSLVARVKIEGPTRAP